MATLHLWILFCAAFCCFSYTSLHLTLITTLLDKYYYTNLQIKKLRSKAVKHLSDLTAKKQQSQNYLTPQFCVQYHLIKVYRWTQTKVTQSTCWRKPVPPNYFLLFHIFYKMGLVDLNILIFLNLQLLSKLSVPFIAHQLLSSHIGVPCSGHIHLSDSIFIQHGQ